MDSGREGGRRGRAWAGGRRGQRRRPGALPAGDPGRAGRPAPRWSTHRSASRPSAARGAAPLRRTDGGGVVTNHTTTGTATTDGGRGLLYETFARKNNTNLPPQPSPWLGPSVSAIRMRAKMRRKVEGMVVNLNSNSKDSRSSMQITNEKTLSEKEGSVKERGRNGKERKNGEESVAGKANAMGRWKRSGYGAVDPSHTQTRLPYSTPAPLPPPPHLSACIEIDTHDVLDERPHGHTGDTEGVTGERSVQRARRTSALTE